jgi:hypothetical protein
MTWFRVDDTFATHPKVVAIQRGAARLRAMGLWTAVGTWCAGHLTDGSFPPHMIDEKGGNNTDARRLIQTGLWHDLGGGCDTESCPEGIPGMYRFHDYLEYNPSRVKVTEERAAAADRQRRARDKAKAKRHGGSHGVTTTVTARSVTVPPTRPDPTPAAAAAEGAPLPPPLEILRGALEAHRLVVRWDRLSVDDATEIEQLIEAHGDNALVASAQRQFQPNKPAAFVQAWLPGWRDLRRPGDLAAVPDADPCPEPGHSGTTRHCVQCASERKAAR